MYQNSLAFQYNLRAELKTQIGENILLNVTKFSHSVHTFYLTGICIWITNVMHFLCICNCFLFCFLNATLVIRFLISKKTKPECRKPATLLGVNFINLVKI